ncbi:MAG: glycoside hydrolase family 18 protein [Patescibacteria group bacterium]
MKKILVLLIIITLVATFYVALRAFRTKLDRVLSTQPVQTFTQPTPTPTSPAAKEIDRTLFVPYWSLKNASPLPPYHTLVYFGVQVGEKGLDTTDDGYKNLGSFVRDAGTSETVLTVRMLDSTTNFAILKDKAVQESLIKDSIALAQKYHFKGILLDIELSALPFSSLVDQIDIFNTKFARASHAKGFTYAVTAYGDTFYRLRPFDIKRLAQDVDGMYVMAYDFSKAKGNPGPNFPLSGSSTYGYDYEHMLNNFADSVPLKKLTIIFGMYGYDWAVDDRGIAQAVGEAVALKDIKANIIDSCKHLECNWERDSVSAETKAIYKDSDTGKHTVWFEDEQSVKRKEDYLKSHGVGSFAYWAYSYF